MTGHGPSIPALVRSAVAAHPGGPAVIEGDRSLSYQELNEQSRRFAGAVVSCGMAPGERVAIWAYNSAEWIVAALGLWQAGCVLVPVNTRFKGAEAADILGRSGARLLVTVTDFLGTDYVELLRGADLPVLDTIVVAAGDGSDGTESWASFLGRATTATLSEADRRGSALGADDPSDILFTSGTTGRPKGVVQTHGRTLRVGTDWVAMTGLRADDRYLMVNPYFHMFGLKAGILASIAAGATMLPQAVFDVDAVLARVQSEKVTVLPGAPTLYQSILDHPARAHYDLSSLRVAVTGAADIPVELIRRVREELPFSLVVTGYGLTEAGTATATSPEDDATTVATTVGRPRPGFELRIADDKGLDVAPGAAGEVLLRGGSVMSHYLDDPAATAAARTVDGWLRTGDLGTVDDRGFLRIVGRSKDMFIVGGFNVYPAEVENFLLEHPDVAQAAVIGIPDRRMGEVGMAFVVPRAGLSLDGPDIVEWARGRMANYKAPRAVEIVNELPLTATGKVQKDVLRQRAMTLPPAAPVTGAEVAPDHGLDALAGLRVVELGVWVAAPAAAALLADWGADVVKVESPAGDPMRYVFGSLGIEGDLPNPAFALDNRGKRSVVLDLRADEDRAALETLLAGADVFVTNLRPDSLDKLGLEPAATVERHPRLVYCSVSGYGLRGADRNRPTYDIGAFWARSGLSMQMADGEGNPLNARGGIGDHITALAALSGILAAVLEQRATGHGQDVVEVSLLRTGAYVLGWDLGLQLALGKVARAEPRHRNQAPLMNPYRTADGRWLFFTGLEAGRHIGTVLRALERTDLLDDPRFAGAAALRTNRVEVIAILDAIVAERSLDEWIERFEAEGVWWAPAQTPAEVVTDPQLLDNDGLVEVDGGALRTVNSPFQFSDVRPRPGWVPQLGQHTDEVRAELRAGVPAPTED